MAELRQGEVILSMIQPSAVNSPQTQLQAANDWRVVSARYSLLGANRQFDERDGSIVEELAEDHEFPLKESRETEPPLARAKI